MHPHLPPPIPDLPCKGSTEPSFIPVALRGEKHFVEGELAMDVFLNGFQPLLGAGGFLQFLWQQGNKITIRTRMVKCLGLKRTGSVP